MLEVKPRRVGGATYQVPIEVNIQRSQTLAMRWLIAAARARTGRPMDQRLADELKAAFKGDGVAVKKRQDVHRMAEANRAFVHYRFFLLRATFGHGVGRIGKEKGEGRV